MALDKLARPSRVDYVASPLEPDEDGVQDIGYRVGMLSDGRAYRLECWRMDDMLMLTAMFADRGLEAYRREDMYLLLESEGILHFTESRRSLQAARTTDDVDHEVWAINLKLADKKGTYAELAVELNSYR